MQMAFDFGLSRDLAYVRERLEERSGKALLAPPRRPVGQLVRSLISARTRDEVSEPAYRRLCDAYPEWPLLTQAQIKDVEAVIADVTFPDVKAKRLVKALQIIGAETEFDLDFLSDWPVERALAWLERLPGVGRKVAAATLNFSTLTRPAFVADSHILRVLKRFGFVRPCADTTAAYDAVMTAASGWSAEDLSVLHLLIKRLGQITCRSDFAGCKDCPIAPRCLSCKPNAPSAAPLPS